MVGRAGDPLPPFVDHMIRHRVDRKGGLYPLAPANTMRCCNVPATEIGFPKGTALKGFLAVQNKSNAKYASLRKKSMSFPHNTGERVELTNHPKSSNNGKQTSRRVLFPFLTESLHHRVRWLDEGSSEMRNLPRKPRDQPEGDL